MYEQQEHPFRVRVAAAAVHQHPVTIGQRAVHRVAANLHPDHLGRIEPLGGELLGGEVQRGLHLLPLERTVIAGRGLRVELAKCSPYMCQWLLEYSSPNVGGVNNPLADLEALEERTLADATARLSCGLIAARRDDDAIEDALANLRGQLEEHFLQRKYAALYER
ncbi:hypothetical protein RM465_13175 [Halomonas sp. PAR7]|nr:hypothetical protein [Halomonas sp. PAR7]MDT0501925.1 hypothetical protein [Halomonas sp. PAR7]